MKRSLLSIISSILALLMIAGAICSCGLFTGDEESSESQSSSAGESEASSGTESESGSESETENGGGNDNKPVVENTGYAPTINYANVLSNGVQSYYTEAERNNYKIENLNMNLIFSLADSKKVTSITNKNGGVYVKDTMDVYLTLEDGTVVYSSSSSKDARPNIYRLGYYYYDVHFLDQDFMGKLNVVGEPLNVNMKSYFTNFNKISGTKWRENNSILEMKCDGGDSYISMPYNNDGCFSYSASDYNAITFKMKTTSATKGQIYYLAGNADKHTDSQSVKFDLIADGEFHEYTVVLSAGAGYTDTVQGIRIDFDSVANEIIQITDVKFVQVETEGVELYLDRTFHTYSDKLHQALHFTATQQITGIKEIGIKTEIATSTVDAIVVKDASGVHYTLEGVDWDTAEYVGFDIKGVGVFGYILPVHENAGKIKVEALGDNYVITQTTCPKDGIINPIAFDDPITSANEAKEVNTTNDFYTGHRIYTDTNHSFESFLKEAEWERNPLGKTIGSDDFIEYDAIVGSYNFKIGGTGFNAPFYYEGNYHYSVNMKLRSEVDRPIYIRTITSSGCLENAVLLSDNNMVLPVQLEVSKNFGGENEEPIHNAGDMTYGETVFPLMIVGGERMTVTVLNLYQNWGAFPLKQLSSIQYFWPYYHLSLGTTETSCISPWYGARDLWTLPDFRSQSMPYWYELKGDDYSNQPQHTHAGYQYFLQYKENGGKVVVATENISNVIDSSGPVYASVDMTYISDDGKIKVIYNHLEMPQEDELRAYYEITYEILDEVSIKDFAKDFSFYSFEGYSGYYQKLGYWAEKGEVDGVVHMDTNGTSQADVRVLGNECPYVALYDLKTSANSSFKTNNANLGFVIHSSEIIIGGEKKNDNFVIVGKDYVYSLSMDLGQVTLKPGDTIKINMIISPWGWVSPENDKNVQDIRENTCLNPLSVTVSEGKKIDSVFLPRIMSTNGKSAEFTLTGGTSNVAVRVYGFNKLTAPKIYVKNDAGGWENYVSSSINTPDPTGYKHYYDGYFPYYDGDGTYSYAFAVDMTDYESRTFKIVAEEDFKAWPTISDPVVESPINVLVPATKLTGKSSTSIKGIGAIELADDGSYVRYYGDGSGTPEAYFEVFKNNADNPTATGKYVVLKYRIPSTNSEKNYFEFFLTTDPSVHITKCSLKGGTVYDDGEWHVMVIDTVEKGHKHFADNGDGMTYYAQYLRLDVFNVALSEDSYVDIAYIGMVDDLSKLFEYERTQSEACERIDVFVANNAYTTYDLSGAIVGNGGSSSGGSNDNQDKVYIDPNNAQGYKPSTTPFISGIDYINGFGDGDASDPAFNSFRSHQNIGPKVYNLDGGTMGNAYLTLTGWTCVYEGIEKYVWSADGGKTWHDAVIVGMEKLGTAGGGVKLAADDHFSKSGIAGFDANTYDQSYYENSSYQGQFGDANGVSAHLVDYVGKEIDVTFAVVPKNAPDTLCVIAHIENVRVYDNDADAESGEACKHDRAYSYVFVDDNDPTTDAAKIAKVCKCGEVVIETVDPAFVVFFDKISGIPTAPFVGENKYGYRVIDALTFEVDKESKAFAANENGYLKFSGWTGLNGGITDFAFRVYDKEGNELTAGWTLANATLTSRNDIASEMTKRGIEAQYGKGYEVSINLAKYISEKDQSVTVKIALVAAGAGADYADKYVYVCEMNNVKVPCAPGEDNEEESSTTESELPSEEDSSEIETEPESEYIDPNNAQGYKPSTVPFISGIDFINGYGDGEENDPAFNRFRSNQKIGPLVYNLNDATNGNAYLVISGWTCVYEGIEKFVWSADGGKTWHDAVIVGMEKLGTAGGGIKEAANGHFASSSIAGFDIDTYNQSFYENSTYQSNLGVIKGIAAHLIDYIGQEVDVTFAVVPKSAPDTLCVINHIQNVRVYASDDDAYVGEPCKHEKVESYVFFDDNDPLTDKAIIKKVCKCGEVTLEVTDPAYVFFFGNIAGVSTAPLVAQKSKGYITIDAPTLKVEGVDMPFSANASGILTISGWAGVNGGIAGVAYRVYDANGNELTEGWTDCAATITSRTDLDAEMTKRGIETQYGKGYSISLDLAQYISKKDEMLKIELALVVDGVIEGSNDKYVYLCEMTNVKVPCLPKIDEVLPDISDKVFIVNVDYAYASETVSVKTSSKKDIIGYDFSGIGSKGDYTLGVYGWAGLKNGIAGVAYRVSCDGVVSDWITVENALSNADVNVQNAVIGSQPEIAGEHAKRFTAYANLAEYLGKSVRVTFAFISAEDGSYVPFFIAMNVEVACDHKTIAPDAEFVFVDDGDSTTDQAKIAATCVCGEKTVDPQDPSYVFYFQELIGASSCKALSSCENKTGYRVYNMSDLSFTASADGMIEIDSWCGVNGGTSNLVYKVYDENGNELTAGWTNFDSTNIRSTTESGIIAEMTKRDIEESAAMRFMDMKINLSSYFAQSSNITLKLALVANGAPEGSNDKYVYLCEMTNLTKAN